MARKKLLGVRARATNKWLPRGGSFLFAADQEPGSPAKRWPANSPILAPRGAPWLPLAQEGGGDDVLAGRARWVVSIEEGPARKAPKFNRVKTALPASLRGSGPLTKPCRQASPGPTR